ncbi:MAG: MBOAT family protein, partial [Planctomycetes bacterium]|nr:MBOAT family protein [Planctomycetota bacterium]
MVLTVLAEMAAAGGGVLEWLRDEIAATPWGDWRDFWLKTVFDDRYLICYFFPLLPLLLLFSGRHLRTGIILTGMLFLGYLFGPLYVLFWLLMCIAFHRLAERYAIEIKRTDVIPWGPHLGAIALVSGWYAGSRALKHFKLPSEFNDWLWLHLPWVFPMGTRGFSWEPWLLPLDWYSDQAAPRQLALLMLSDPHLIGTAYFTIRMLHYFSEIKRGGIAPERRSLLNFLAYLFYAPTLMQGPIERFNEFQNEMDTCHERRGWSNLPPALARISFGLFKCLFGIIVFTHVMWDVLGITRPGGGTYYQTPEKIESYALLYFGVYFQFIWLYLEFSGYCDISAGIARLLGYRQVENFKRPWLATDLRDVWRRWHITLSLIARDYIYIALGGNRRHKVRNLCVTFILIGIWHVMVPKMALWGLVMGLMLVVNQWWAAWMKRLDQTTSGAL